jgi:hypothetical protein
MFIEDENSTPEHPSGVAVVIEEDIASVVASHVM